MTNYNHSKVDSDTGVRIYYLDHQKHRSDGYAICYPDGTGQYWLFGERFPSLPEFEHRLRKEEARERRAAIQKQNIIAEQLALWEARRHLA